MSKECSKFLIMEFITRQLDEFRKFSFKVLQMSHVTEYKTLKKHRYKN